MSPLDYLRGVVLRDRKPALSAPPSQPLPTLTWSNPMTTRGGCIHDVIYSRCYCDQRKPTAQ